MQLARSPLAAGAFAVLLLLAPVRAQSPLPLQSLLQGLGLDASCAQLEVLGQCFCGPVPCGLSVRRFVPVAVIETTRAPGDSLLTEWRLPMVPDSAGPAGATVSSALSQTDNTAEVHVWTLPGVPLPLLGCALCGAAAAAVPTGPASADAAPLCSAASAVTDAVRSAGAALAGAGLPALAYASELDAVAWRTGCRDLGEISSWLARGVHCLGPALPGAFAQTPDPLCLGAWGALRPRQMRDIGPSPILYSAKTAVRAMSLARDPLGNFAYPVDTAGQMQQLYPVVSACFRVGELPLPATGTSERPVAVSADGRYAWLYWRQASCCVGAAGAAACLRALHP